MPYKKPKEADDGTGTAKGKVKVIKGKLAKLHSAKLIKNAKSIGKVNSAKMGEKAKATIVEKNSIKSPVKDDKKRKESTKDEKTKPHPTAKKVCTLAVQTKKSPLPKGVVTKEVILNVKFLPALPKGIQPQVKGEPKTEGGKSNSPKGSNMTSKASSTSPKSNVQKNDANVTEKANHSTVEKENAAASKQKSVKVDSGTQSMKSMIGINRVKAKPTDPSPPNEGVAKDEKASLSNAKDNVTMEESMESKEVDVVDAAKEKDDVTEKIAIESKSSEDTSATGKEDISTADTETKNKEEINSKEKEPSNKVGESIIEGEKLEDSKVESKNAQEPKEPNEDKEKTMESKTITDSIMTRGRRSASRSPVVARETKSSEVASPRKGRSSGTPDRKREDKQITPTVMTRKRLASFSESEGDKKADETPGGKRRALAAALLEKMSRKTSDSLATLIAGSSKVQQEHTYAKETKDLKEPEKEGESKFPDTNFLAFVRRRPII